jgi:hypothetical protein
MGSQEETIINYPQYSNISVQYNNLFSHQYLFNTSYVNVSWTCADGLSKVLIEHNQFGTLQNYTMDNSFGGSIYNYTFNVTTFPSVITWRSIANCTTNTYNTTANNTFGISDFSNLPTTLGNTVINVGNFLTAYCLNNNTLIRNGTINNQSFYTVQGCPYGCEETLNVCRQSPLIEALIVIGIVIAIIILLWFLIKKVFRI